MMICYTERHSPLGLLTIAASEQGLCGLYFEQHKYFAGAEGWRRDTGHALLLDAARQVDEYFGGERTSFDIGLDLRGTPFQRAVWSALGKLPFGSAESYGAVAARIGNPVAVRAVASAIGRNPVSIIVPCHRVIGSKGALTGYAGGLPRKEYLLALESRRGSAR